MRRTSVLFLIALAPFGCKKDTPEEAAPAAAAKPILNPATVPANPLAKPGAGNPQDPAQAMAQLGNMMAATQQGGGKTVSWREIVPILVDDAAGWKGEEAAKGETNAMGAFSVSEASRHYKKDGVTAKVKIVDTNMNAMLAAGFNMARMANVDASDHYNRPIDIAGQPGVEEWHSSKSGKVTVLVAGRFIVEVEASGIADTKGLAELTGKLDLGKLASMK
jgi:hypothetical protein